MPHPVIAALRSRPAGARIALVVEGGGMRGAVSGGMALGLDELGLAHAFDAAYGSSAGTLNAMWLVSGRVRDGIPTWTDPRLVHELISRRRALLRGGPVVDVRRLVEERYEQLSPGLFDAGLSAAIPFRAALDDGATHVLVLRSRRAGETAQPPGRLSGALAARALRRLAPALEAGFHTRAEREAEDEALLARHDADPSLEPAILSVRPAPGSAVPARLERDIDVIRAGLEAGRQAAHAALGSP